MEKKEIKGISGSTLKIIAIVTMFIDHVAAAILARVMLANGVGELDGTDMEATMLWLSDNGTVYWTYTVMRAIGRIAFPIFCFLLIEGFEHTRSRAKYALRLGLFALISEVPFDLAFHSEVLEFGYQNVFFTLFIGLLAMMAYHYIEERQNWNKGTRMLLGILVIVLGMGAAQMLGTDYAAMGVLTIMVLFVCRKSKQLQIVAGAVCVVFFLQEFWALLAFIPIAFYNGKRGWNAKYVFYLFYPVHLLLLYLICWGMGISAIPAI